MAKHEDGFLREIDDELRQEHYARLWKTYGNFIIVAAVCLIAVVGGYQGWRAYDIKTRTEMGEQFNKAQLLLMEDKAKEAEAIFSSMAVTANAGYAMLARFQQASMQTPGKNSSAGYRELASDTSVDVIYRDLAQVLGVIHDIKSSDTRELTSRLAPLTAADNPWHYSALEITALLAMRSGDTDKARGMLKSLSDDAAVPNKMRTRTLELLAAMGGAK